MKQFLTIKDLTDRYGVSRASIYNHIKAGRFPQGVVIGHSRRWSIKELEAFEAGLTQEAQA